jgi:hypothetical protein
VGDSRRIQNKKSRVVLLGARAQQLSAQLDSAIDELMGFGTAASDRVCRPNGVGNLRWILLERDGLFRGDDCF